MLNVLIACEESQRVCIEMRKLGHRAFSCDILPCSGGHPEWHIQGDVLKILNPNQISESFYGVVFKTSDGEAYAVRNGWDLIIAHPPCTYLTLAGNKWFKKEFESRFPDRAKQRDDASDFFMKFVNADCQHIAIENPVGIMSSRYRKPDQYIEPFWFGDAEKKKNWSLVKRAALSCSNKFGRACDYPLQIRRERTEMAYGNNETTERRTKQSQKQNLPRHCPCYGRAMDGVHRKGKSGTETNQPVLKGDYT